MEYIDRNPGANRIGLVSPPPCNHCYINADFSQAVGRSRRSRLSSCETRNTRRFERSQHLFWVAFSYANILLLVQHSHQPQRPCPLDGFRIYLGCSWIELCPSARVAGVYTQVGCTRDYQGREWGYTGGGHLFFWHGCHRGQFSSFPPPGVWGGGIVVFLISNPS